MVALVEGQPRLLNLKQILEAFLAHRREVVVRPVLAIDAEAEQEFVRGLSLYSRRRRFHLPIRERPLEALPA